MNQDKRYPQNPSGVPSSKESEDTQILEAEDKSGPTLLDVDSDIEAPRHIDPEDEDGDLDDDSEGGVSAKSKNLTPKASKDEFEDDELDEPEAETNLTRSGAGSDSPRSTAPQQGRRPPERRSPPRTAKEVFEELALDRARVGNPKLRASLMGTILFQIENGGQSYIFDWASDAPQVRPVTSGASNGSTLTDCVIKITEPTLLQITTGELNPQIALISEKVKVEGNMSLAIYFFNLLAP